MDIFEYWYKQKEEREYGLTNIYATLSEIGAAMAKWREEQIKEAMRGETK